VRKFSCDEARAELSGALAGAIGRPEANLLDAHLLECDSCRSLAELFLWQDRVLTELAAEARMEHLTSRVRDGLKNLDQVSIAEEQPAIRFRRRLPIGWVAAAAVFALVLAGVLLRKPTPSSESVSQAPAVDSRPAEPNVEPQPEPQEPAAQTPEPEPAAPHREPSPAPAPAVAEVQKPLIVPAPPPKSPEPVLAKADVSPAPDKAPAPAKSTAGAEVVTPPPKPRTLDDAVRGGMAYLKSKSAVFAKDSKSEELLLWTYVQGGLPENDAEFQAGLKSVLEKKLEKTYNVALMAMLLEELDRVKYQKRIAQCAQYLLDNQCANGQWSYGDPSIFVESVVVPPPLPKSKGLVKVPMSRKRDGPASGDNSNTMYALLGLRACHDAGIVLPAASVELAAKWWRDTQTKLSKVKAPAIAPEGWCYGKHDHKPYGSMTAGGVGSLAICDYILGRDPKKDRELACGMEWLGQNFSVTFNPGPFEHANFEVNSQHQLYYYLYGLERAAILTGNEQIGGMLWYPRASQALIDLQRPDGSWKSASGSELHDTCFAVLTLRKATRALIDVATGPPPKKP
jgi:hypothetical protein